jgi:tRNA threonylcarbamoyladenosine biosynthesis protein TsaB
VILAIDTSTRLAGVALYGEAQILAETIWHSRDYHSVELVPTIQAILKQTGVPVTDLRLVAVATGPGSFTGLRIGLAAAKGIALGLHLPIVGIPTLDFLAAAQPLSDAPMFAVLRAGRGRLSVGKYRVFDGKWTCEDDLKVLDIQTLSQQIIRPTYVCGELTAEERHFLGRKWKNAILASPSQSIRRPSFLAELAWQRFSQGQVDDPVTLSPIYLHIGEIIPE